jgi:YggT family protein
VPVFDAISSIQLFLSVFVDIYVLALILWVLLTWFKLPYSLRPVQRFLDDVCQPYLGLWRRYVPLRFGPIDLTPMVAILALLLASRVVIALLGRLH